jgi:hypothetical protein
VEKAGGSVVLHTTQKTQEKESGFLWAGVCEGPAPVPSPKADGAKEKSGGVTARGKKRGARKKWWKQKKKTNQAKQCWSRSLSQSFNHFNPAG